MASGEEPEAFMMKSGLDGIPNLSVPWRSTATGRRMREQYFGGTGRYILSL